MTPKKKIALYWCSSCGGCDESVFDLAEDILMVSAKADIVFWPIALDFKYKDVESLDDREIALTLINGSIRMDEHEGMVRLLREKSEVLMAHGSCAHLGGVYGLGNFFEGQELLDRSYKEVPTTNNPDGTLPQPQTMESGRELKLANFHDRVRALNQVADVDYYIPGCPPTPQLIKDAILMAMEGRLPPKGSVLADTKALCDTCSRRDSRPEKIRVKAFKRLHETLWDPTRCFLDQGLICLGPATRGGCWGRCIEANMPCRGCFGPTDQVKDQGAKSVSFIASMIDSQDEHELEEIIRSIPDPAGLFYRYSLPTSMLKGKISKQDQ
jgi:F420-non-reducing hydrogenase small subunit